MSAPLSGVTVLEFSQYLAGPYAGLRLADLGARVIKIEMPGKGDACRQLATKNQWLDNDSVLFHTVNRNKESFIANLKDADDASKVKKLIANADIVTHNFRPGIMQRLGFDYENVSKINPKIIYGEVSGYGAKGPWRHKPGQDLLAQSLSGLTWLTGNADSPPIPFGIAVADMLCGTHLCQGLLAALVQRERRGCGAKVCVSLMESIVDLQFEVITAFLNDHHQSPHRGKINSSHAYLGAPYGVYATKDTYIAISMGSLQKLCECINCTGLESYYDKAADLELRDEINLILAKHFETQTTRYWLNLLEPNDFWCSAVYDYHQLVADPAYKIIDMEQTVSRGNASIKTTRCPIRINGKRLTSPIAAPRLGASNAQLITEFEL